MKNEIDMTHGPLLKKIFLFSIPLMASGVLQLLFNAADIAVVGQFAGPKSIAAVGATAAVVNLLVNLFVGLGVGVNVLVARFYALHQNKDIKEAISSSIVVGLIGGLLFGIIGILLAKPILTAMSCPVDVIDLSILYLRIYFVGLPFVALYNVGSAVLRAIGDTRRPMIFLIIAGITNIILNLFFVIVLKIDVAGVALATMISQVVSSFLVLRVLYLEDSAIHFSFNEIVLSRDKVISILKIGLPAGLQGSLFSISNIMVQSQINTFGSIVVAGNAAALSLEGFVYQMMNAFYQACVTFTSQNYGIRDEKRVQRVFLLCSALVIVIGAIFGNLNYLISNYSLRIYTKDLEAISYGHLRMSYMCKLHFLCGLMEVICGSVRGLGYSTVPMFVSVFGACVFRIAWIFTIFQQYHTLESIYISYPISWALTAFIHFLCFLYFKKKAFN